MYAQQMDNENANDVETISQEGSNQEQQPAAPAEANEQPGVETSANNPNYGKWVSYMNIREITNFSSDWNKTIK